MTAIVYCLCCLFMVASALTYALEHTPLGFAVLAGVMAAGTLVYAYTCRSQ